MTTRSTARPDNRVLNVLRSVSAFAVVVGHVRLLFVQDYSSAPHTAISAALYAVTSFGSEAVIVFFVLSGYFVGGGVVSRLKQQRFSWFDYGNSRLTRLWLVLIPALVLTLVADTLGRALFPQAMEYVRPTAYAGMNTNPALDPVTFLGNLAFLQGLHVPEYGTDYPLWSLAYEAWYYLLFPAVLVLVLRNQSVLRRVAGAALALIGVAVAGPSVLLLFPYWLLGALVAAYRQEIAAALKRLGTRTRAAARGVLLMGVFLAAVIVRLDSHLPSRSGAWLLAVVAAALVAVFVTDVKWTGRVGRALDLASSSAHSSYSLYAIHMPVVVFLAAWLVPSPERRLPMGVGTLAACVGIAAAISLLAYAFARMSEMQTDRVRSAVDKLARPGFRGVTAKN